MLQLELQITIRIRTNSMNRTPQSTMQNIPQNTMKKSFKFSAWLNVCGDSRLWKGEIGEGVPLHEECVEELELKARVF